MIYRTNFDRNTEAHRGLLAATLHRGLQGERGDNAYACSVRPRAEPVAFALWVVRG